MSGIIEQSKDLVTHVKSVIFKYCPYVENRLSILRNSKSPEIDIEVNIRDNKTQVVFLFGNSNFKNSVLEQIIIPYVIEFTEISEIIDFILGDHEFVKNIRLYNNSIELNFAINWNDKSIKGINCGDIRLYLKFNNNVELEKQYLYLLFQMYYFVLEHTPSFKKIKNEYIDSVKQSYLNTLDKVQLITLLNTMSEIELKELLFNLDNDIFIKYATASKPQTKVKKLFLEKDNKNN